MWLGIANHSITPKQKNHRRTQISTPRQNSHCITARKQSADRSWTDDGSNARLEDGDLKKQSPKNSGRPPQKTRTPLHAQPQQSAIRSTSPSREQGRPHERPKVQAGGYTGEIQSNLIFHLSLNKITTAFGD